MEWKMVVTFKADEPTAVLAFTNVLATIREVTGQEAGDGATVEPVEGT
jgi:hypothetical protein